MLYSFGDVIEIPAGLKDIYILAGGPSCDLFFNTEEGKKLSRETGIIITCNGSISQVKPHFQICGDRHAVSHWAEHPNNDKHVVWIAKPRVDLYFDLKINCIRHEDLFDGEYVGTGHEAFAFAYYLQHFFPIENIYYTGMDCSELILPRKSRSKNGEAAESVGAVLRKRIVTMQENNKYSYPHRGEVMPFQKTLRAPDKWWMGKYEIKMSEISVYKKHLKAIAQLILHEDFCNKLRCRSFLDITRLNYRKHAFNYPEAITHGFHNS